MDDIAFGPLAFGLFWILVEDLGRSGVEDAVDGGVDLLEHQSAALFVAGVADPRLGPVDDSGDALHVDRDEHLHVCVAFLFLGSDDG